MDPFEMMFGGGGMGSMRGMGGGRQRGPPRGESTMLGYPVTLDELYTGHSRTISLNKKIICVACKNFPKQTCAPCKGNGSRIRMAEVMPGFAQQMRVPCNDCFGTGKRASTVCTDCKGLTVKEGTADLTVKIEPGMCHHDKITFTEAGDQEPGVIPGDVVLVLKESKHDKFERTGVDLHTEHTLTLIEALCGTKFHVTHLDKRSLVVTHPAGQVIKPGQTMTIKGEGFPTRSKPRAKGDLHITFRVIMDLPSSLLRDDATTLALQNLLPATQIAGVQRVPANPELAEEVFLEDVDPTRRKGAHGRDATAEDGDDDDDRGRGHAHAAGGIPCAQQ